MSDYIKREDAYSTLTDFYRHKREIQHESLRYALNYVPSADVAPVRHGKWMECASVPHWKCSCCGYQAPVCWDSVHQDYSEWLADYCPNCGVKMDEEETEE